MTDTATIRGIGLVCASLDGDELFETTQDSQTKKVTAAILMAYATAFTQTMSTLTRSLADKCKDWLHLRDFPGIDLTGATSSSAAIADAIVAAIALGAGSSKGVAIYTGCGTLAQNTPYIAHVGVHLRGDGRESTYLTIVPGANCDVVQSVNFNSLTRTNKWLTSDGVPYSFGIEHMTIDGNKANQTAGTCRGIANYSKNTRMHDLMIKNCKGIGLYTECAAITSNPDYTNAPESSFTDIWTRDNGDDGIHNCGPHDAVWDRIVSCFNGGWDVQVLRVLDSAGTAIADGTCVIGNLHTYGGALGGFYSNTGIRGGLLILENPHVFAGTNNVIASLRTSLGSQPGVQTTISGSGSSIGSIRGSFGHGQSGVLITGTNTTIGMVNLSGRSQAAGYGVSVDAGNVTIGGGIIRSASGIDSNGPGHGLIIGEVAVRAGLDINLTLQMNGYNVLFAHAPIASRIRLRSIAPVDSTGILYHVDPAGQPLNVQKNDVFILGEDSSGSGSVNYVRNSTGGWRAVSADEGDASVVFTPGTSKRTLLFNTPLSSPRTVSFASGFSEGEEIEVIRGPGCTGSNLTVNFATPKVLVATTPGSTARGSNTGSAWQQTGYGSL